MAPLSFGTVEQLSLLDIVKGLSGALDLVNPAVVDHHGRVACIAHSISVEMGLAEHDRHTVLWAALLHDIGAFSLQERLEFLNFEFERWYPHCHLGYRLVQLLTPLSEAADLIRYHHCPWEDGRGREFAGNPVPLGSHILHLADRVAVLIRPEQEVFGQIDGIVKRISGHSGRLFHPDLVETFRAVSVKESMWLDATYPDKDLILRERCGSSNCGADLTDIESLALLFCRIIDFRSPYTATHSSGVAAVVEHMAGLTGLSDTDCLMMKVAGYLHDMGKLAVPSEILDKAGPLNPDEWRVMRKHPYLSYRVLGAIKGLERLTSWVGLHHERLDGEGYPFRLRGDDIPLGARILSVADIFTALSEDRPYRPAMTLDQAANVLRALSGKAIDPTLVEPLLDNRKELDLIRRNAQDIARELYRSFHEVS